MSLKLASVLFVCWLLTPVLLAEAIPVDFADDKWNTSDNIHPMIYFGKPAAIHSGGVTTLKDVQFVNGRIDVDVNMHGHRSFAGLVFRHQDDGNFELVYFRPHKSGLPDAVQYIPRFNGASTWQLYHEGYLAAANFEANRWMHIRLVFIDRTLSVFIDDESEASLLVEDLQRDIAPGSIGLWGRPAMHFANFSFEVYEDSNSVKPAPTVAIQSGVLTDWALSSVFEAALNPLTKPLAAQTNFEPVAVEGAGFVNISRYRSGIALDKRTDTKVRKDVVYARTTFVSSGQTLKKLWLGYSDEVMVYLNGKPIYEGHSAFNHRAPLALGLLGMQNDALYLPLEEGENTLVLAVAEIFGGWGFMAKFENPEGLSL